MIKSIVLISLIAVFASSNCTAGENPQGRTRTGDVGDALQVVIPLSALAVAWGKEDDKAGVTQFLKGFGATMVSTYGLKAVVSKERPDGRDDKAIVSSHTAVSFHAAAFLHERYGWAWGVPAYIAASYVGYSRVHDDRHDEKDVLLGAVLGVAAARLFSTEFQGGRLSPEVSVGYVGLRFERRLGGE